MALSASNANDEVFCYLCKSESGRVGDIRRHFRKKHGSIKPREGKPAFGGNWVRKREKNTSRDI